MVGSTFPVMSLTFASSFLRLQTCEAFCRDAGADMFGLQFGSQ